MKNNDDYHDNYREKHMGEMVVKTHKLNMAIQNLTLFEIKLLSLAIVDARESNTGLSADKPLYITALRFSEMMGIDSSDAYKELKKAEQTLFERRFTFLSDRNNEVHSRWISQAEYHRGEGAISIILTPAVVNEITRINGAEEFFSQYAIEQIANLSSVYSVRLYELVNQWRKAGKAYFELELFRAQMGVPVNEYKAMGDFKKRVLDNAVEEINKKTDLDVSYTQKKRGRTIIGFTFNVRVKPAKKIQPPAAPSRDPHNADMFTIDNLTDAQLVRITISPQFIRDFSDQIAPTDAINKDMNAWSTEFVKRIKQDPTPFNKKRPIKEYLNYD